jgi:hypothetical protein
MKKRMILGALLALIMGLGLAAAQDMSKEAKSEVPELTAFHEIIYPIWHTAYPEKDVNALRSYVPKINELAANVYAAKLPGILREKEAVWKEGLAQLKKAVEAYNSTASGKDDKALLDAAEALHSRYEGLVRALNPVLREMDEFHKLLYVFNHTYLPEKAYDKIRADSSALVTKAEAVVKATLPKRLEAKSEAFKKGAAELLDAAKALDAAGKAHDHDGMEAGVEKVHARYEALQKLFE